MNTNERLKALYDKLPTVACKGLCWNSCGPIDMSTAERERITDLGVDIPLFDPERAAAWAAGEKLYCPALKFGTRDGGVGCSVYEARPLICRAWGVGTGEMACPHGCETSDTLEYEDLMRLLMESFEIGGHPEYGEGVEEEAMRMLEDPEIGPLWKRAMQGDQSARMELEELLRARRA